MANFQLAIDTPNRIRYEGQEIILTFVKTSPTTGRVSWNIPDPTIGCNVDTQAYNGIVITYDSVHPSLSTTPSDKVVYSADATASTTLHAGDKIGTSLVIGAFYDDKETSFFDIDNLPNNTPIYVSGYAVDKQLRYHRGGVHAFSMSTGIESPNKREQLPAYQMILLGLIDNSSLFDINLYANGNVFSTGANAGDPTGLSPTQSYTFTLFMDKCDNEGTTITVDGAYAQTFGDLVNQLSIIFSQLNNPLTSAGHPNVNGIFLNVANSTVYVWDGSEHIVQPTLSLASDPGTINTGEFWFKASTDTLKQWTGVAWNTIPYITSEIDPVSNLSQASYWYDGNLVHHWNGVVWCDSTTYVSETDPSSAPVIPSGTYWFNTETKIMYAWDELCNEWKSMDVIYDATDPENITTGDYWFNPDNNILYVRGISVWSVYGYKLTVSTVSPASPVVNEAWFNTSTDTLQFWNGSSWIQQDVTIYHLDPTDRTSCQLWWNSTDDNLYVWTFASPNGWVLVTNFIESVTDPAEIPSLDAGTAWFKSSSQELFIWDGIDWNITDVIIKPTAPNLPANNDVWYTTSTNIWKIWNSTSSSWNTLTPFVSELDRSSIAAGTYWHNPTGPSVSVWNGMAWMSVSYSTTPYTPVIGFQYFNTTDSTLYEWTSTGWTEGVPPLYAILNTQGNLVFITGAIGSQAYVKVKDYDLFLSITTPTAIYNSEPGRDEIPGIQGYAIEGVGTDGTYDERKQLHSYIKHSLGYPSFAVELSQEQLDICTRKAIEEFRLRSASAYKRGFFFLNIVPGKQIYELTDKTVGFNTIVRVMAAYRIQSSFLGNATGQGAYGQAMLQHLYQMGSFDLVSYHIMSDYVELMNMMFAANLVFVFDEDTRKLYFHQTFGSNERILLDVVVERTEQDLLRDRMTKVWLERYALGKAMLILSEGRGKYATLPGAGGGVTLNAQDLRTAGQELIDTCYAEIDDYIANEIENIGIGADIVMG